MSNPRAQFPSNESMTFLSRLLLLSRNDGKSLSEMTAMLEPEARKMNRAEFDQLVTLADSNHVIVRGLELFFYMMSEAKDDMRAEWAHTALVNERARIRTALMFLNDVLIAFEEQGHDVTVIKSLDHWPDLGSDLDLYTNANPEDVSELMRKRFDAQIASRSWGDRLAGKWNFHIPGLLEAVEIHMGRLGQTGEQVAVASSIMKHTQPVLIGGHIFRVPSNSDRLMISTLQRMYRHFYFRLCDIIDSAALLETSCVDFENLQSQATHAGIWEGVATYLMIVSDYVRQYRGSGIDLPQSVMASARFGGEEVYYSRSFLRVPIMPQSAKLYGSQLAGVFARGELHNGVRLSLLPWLATAAAVGQMLTGSDKGIW